MEDRNSFARPTNDLLFKRCIGNADHPEVAQGLIGDILGIEVGQVVVQNPYSIARYQEDLERQRLGTTAVDVLVRLVDRSQVVIEMQVARQEYFLERALFYTASHFASDYGRSDLKRGARRGDAKYSSLYPVYNISILDFQQFEADADPLHAFSLYDVRHKVYFGPGEAAPGLGGLMSLVFLELGKPKAGAGERIGWMMDFFNGRGLPDEAPGYLKQALKLVDEQNLTREEIEMIDLAERAEEDRKAQIAFARKEGEKRGEKRGEKLGEKRGEDKKAADVAKAALREGLEPDAIAKITGLDREAIERIKSEPEG